MDGKWSAWSPESECSAKCGGGGTKSKTRNCASPFPLEGGSVCEGISSCGCPSCGQQPCPGMCIHHFICINNY